jgi:hypothetical protein
LAIVTTTSPVPPGKSKLPAAGEATAVMVKLAVLADWASPLDPAATPVTQLVAA